MAGRPHLSNMALGPAGLAVAVVAVQLLVAATGTRYYLTQMTMAAYYVLVVLGLCLLMGYAGQISLGHAGFFAIGGYAAAVITTIDLSPHAATFPVSLLLSMGLAEQTSDAYGNGLVRLSPWLALMAAVVLAVVVAVLIGVPVLRLRGHYLAMATLGFGTIVYRIVLGTPLCGEADGISGVPGFAVFPGLVVSGAASSRVANYYFAWALVLLVLTCLLNLVRSRLGRALRAIHGNEEAADAMGIDTAGLKIRVFVLSAACAAVAGVFLTHYNGGIGPSEAGAMKSVRYVALVAVGGMASLWGALAWGTLLSFLSLRGVFGSYDDAVFGTILVVVMLLAPDGFGRSRVGEQMRTAWRQRSGRGPA